MIYNVAMDIGISTASFFTRLYTEQAIVPISKIGANFCEVFFATHSEYSHEFGQEILKEVQKARQMGQFDIYSVHALTNQFEPELFSVNDRAFNDAITMFNKVCAIAKQIGAKCYTFHGATMLKKAVKYSFNYDHIASRINLLCDIAESYGIRFCYENVHWTFFNNPEYFNNIKDKCPKVGAVLDIKQAMQSEIDYKQYLQAMGDRLCTVHLCDYDLQGNVQLPGKGIVDFVELFQNLIDMDFKGNCIMEVYAKSYESESQLKESYDYLQSCLKKAKESRNFVN